MGLSKEQKEEIARKEKYVLDHYKDETITELSKNTGWSRCSIERAFFKIRDIKRR